MQVNRLTCQEAKKLLLSGDAVLVDVRHPQEFRLGALPDAINVPLHLLPGALDQFRRNTQLILYCMTGRRSAQARMVLQSMGLDLVHDLGSYHNWKAC